MNTYYMNVLPSSKPQADQSKILAEVPLIEDGQEYTFRVIASHRDSKKTGFNTFSLSGEVYRKDETTNPIVSGRMVAEIKELTPQFAHLIRWSGMKVSGIDFKTIMFFKANRQIDRIRQYTGMPDITMDQITEEYLHSQMPDVMEQFKKDVESIGFIY